MATATDKAQAHKQLPVDQLILQDHDKVRNLCAKFQEASGTDSKQHLAFLIIRELSVHSSKEEEVVYPEIAKVFGEAERDHLLAEHTVLKQTMADVSRTDPGSPQFDALIASLLSQFEHHATAEEDKEIPRLLAARGVDAVALGTAFDAAGKHAVTRPHTWAPDKPPLNWFINRLQAPIDAAADAFRFAGEPSAGP